MKATDDGGYTVTYLNKEKGNYFKNSEMSPVITLVLGIISAFIGCVPIIRGK